MSMRLERRFVTADLELRARADGGKTLAGYAAIFNRLSENLGGFVEQVAPAAFAKTLDEADIRHLLNHDPSVVFGRNRAGTLRLAEDTTGLHYEVDLPNTQAARDLAESVDRGDITGSSFGFRTIDDEWGLTEQGFPVRTLRQVHLYDTSTVTFPAYPSTQEDDVKAAVRSLAARVGRPIDELAAAAAAGELRSVITTSEDASSPAPPEQHSTAQDRIAVYRRRLEVLER